MAKKQRKQPLVTAWSFSRYKQDQECPRQLKFSVVDKVKTPSSPAMARGDRIHQDLEQLFLGNTTKPPRDLKAAPLVAQTMAIARGLIADAKRARATIRTELQAAVDERWQPTGYFDASAWLRVKLDLLIDYAEPARQLRVIDHKSGRPYADHQEQLDLYAPVAFILYPDVQEIIAQMFYVDQGELGPESVYKRSQLPKLKKTWERKTARMLGDTELLPTPSERACGRCAFRSDRIGPAGCDEFKKLKIVPTGGMRKF